ncbi:MAG TPA: TIR domain-containing protein, partial [Pyrinomonadaceae bacterium]|nr:TIR domain-containing protein [Pyrinomonadaceae bacterium]
GRFFRDDDEMGASTDLGGTLREALESSENLIVICSPHAARSKWVNAEILHFKNSGAGDRIFAVVADGTPKSDDPESNCFPPALSSQTAGAELLSEHYTEPLGIDLRKEPFQRSRIRLVAGLLGISFDSLWQREKRRTMKRRAVAAVVTMVLASVIVLLGVKWLAERRRVNAQRVDGMLVKVRNDLASERVQAALTDLESLVAEGEKGVVDDVLKTALAWVSTPAELLKEIKPPAFITNGPQLFFLAGDGSRHLLQINQPYRRILSSDKRRLLIISDEDAIILNVADGRELARAPTNGIQWKGHAFETGSGLLIVGGRFFGLTNGSLRCAFLVFSPRQQTLSVFNENPVREALFHSLAVSPDCRKFGIVKGDPAAADQSELTLSSDMFFFSADTSGLKPSTTPESIADWQAVVLYTDLAGDLNAFADGPGNFPGAGCVAPNSDSASPGSQPGATGLFRPIGLGTFWESEQRWKVIKENVDGDGPPDGNSPCTEERPCRVQNPRRRSQDDSLLSGWDSAFISPPRGVHKDDRSFASVANEAVYFGYSQYQSGVQAAWCRNLNAKVACFVSLDQFELQDEQALDLRSNSGRFIFNPRGMTQGFQLYDLSTMRDVSPKGTEIVAGTQHADFSLNDERLFVVLNGRLLVFTPSTAGGAWQLVSDAAPISIPALSGNKDDKVAGLFALDDNHLVVVSSSGVISRFDWRTGQQSWSRTISSVGEVHRAVVSKNRRFVFIIGSRGGRLFATTDGLVLSGTLVPPGAMDGSVEMLQCFHQAFLSDTGTIELSCGEKEYRRELVTFSGDVRSRLREVLADGP